MLPKYAQPPLRPSSSNANLQQTTSNSQSQPIDSPNADLIRSLQQAFKTASAEHFPSSTIGIYPTSNTITLVLVANKYSPQNFWNGRWRSTYTFDPSSSSLSGNVKIDVHYYEDGNVRMNTTKKVEAGNVGGGAEAVVKEIAKAENKFQEELNRAFTALAEGSFKGLRRQLPVTRQRMEWEKHQGYRVSSYTYILISSSFLIHVLTIRYSWVRTLVVDGLSSLTIQRSLAALRTPAGPIEVPYPLARPMVEAHKYVMFQFHSCLQ